LNYIECKPLCQIIYISCWLGVRGAFQKSRTFFLALKGRQHTSPGQRPIAVRLRQTRSGARSQALPGNVFLAALPPDQFVGGRATSENVPRQSLGTSTLGNNLSNVVALKGHNMFYLT